MRKAGNKEAGFSLIELAVLLVLAGLLTSAVLETYRAYSITKEINDTDVRRGLVTNALSQYVRYFGRLPCPADPSLPPDDPNAGLEICLEGESTGGISQTDPPGGYGLNYPTDGCSSEVCRVPGRIDTGADGNLLPDKVLIGAVPYVTIGLTLQDTIDGWGGKMTYAVSEFLTNDNTYNDSWGTINRQIKNTGTGNIIDAAPVGENMLVLLSHGPDRKGAWNYHGQQISPCAGPGLDVENCDGDSDFIQQGSTDTCEADNTCMVSYAPGANFYDDAFTEFQISRDSDKWQYSTATTIENKTGGAVGIGVAAPDTSTGRKLHVGGNLLVNDNTRADQYCNSSESDCFDSDMIGGIGISCSNGLMTGISDENAVCANTINPTLITPSTCPGGQYVTGIDATGNLICN